MIQSAALFAAIICSVLQTDAFVPSGASTTRQHKTAVKGYLDELAKYTYDPDSDIKESDDSREATNYSKEKLDRFGPGDFKEFVDFNEFDGGDGRKLMSILKSFEPVQLHLILVFNITKKIIH